MTLNPLNRRRVYDLDYFAEGGIERRSGSWERRSGRDRRSGKERRMFNDYAYSDADRRSGEDRRSGKERRRKD